MPEALIVPALFVARILVGAPFIVGGLRHFWALDPITGAMTARGVPQARLVLIVGSVWQVVFGVALALGLFVTISALALIVFTVLATFMLVNFWDLEGRERDTMFNVFMSNVALVGGLLALAAAG